MRRFYIITAAIITIAAMAIGASIVAQNDDKATKKAQHTAAQNQRQQHRAERMAAYERYVDSLVLSHNYRFTPQTIQQLPAGIMRNLANPAYEIVVRSEECRGAGFQTIEMNFLPDVYVKCRACGGNRYNRETLEVKYKGKSINDVLNMTINMAVEFFEHIPSIYQKLRAIQEVGLGYLTLGQPCTTLSGGESQRIKLATELSKRETGRTLYILDEPTTGLHFEDVRQLLGVINRLVDCGNTAIVIEHNLDVIKVADWIIDMGPEGGSAGGMVVAEGTPHTIATTPESYTGQYLKPMLK